MRVRFAGVRATGRAVDLRSADVDPHAVLAAIRAPSDERVRCRAPGPVHEHVGHLHEDLSFDLRGALAAAARSRGIGTPQDDELAELATREPIEAQIPPDPRAARRRVAEADADVAALRERVERLGGRIEARRTLDAPTDAVERRYREAVRELAGAETERLAAEQTLDGERAIVDRARDHRQAALGAVDRRRNLERAARAHLVSELADSFRLALRAVAGGDPATPDTYDGPPLPAALAIARVARVRAPLVVEVTESGPFTRPARAAASLDAPVLLV